MRLRLICAVTAVLAATVAATLASAPSSRAAPTCPNPIPVIDENFCKGPGSTAWRLTNYSPTAVAGFTTATSVNKGQNVTLKVGRLNGSGAIDLRVFRMGYYGGTGGRLVHSANNVSVTQSVTCGAANTTTGLMNCNNWPNTYTIPSSALPASGVYLVRLIDRASTKDNHVLFTVRDDARNPGSDLLYKLPISTFQAYNAWGGKSLYTYNSTGANTISGSRRAVKVSFSRPFDQANTGNDWFLKSSYPLLYWLERQGYDVAYTDNVSVHQNGGQLTNHKAVVLNGHDEYWTREEFAAHKAARDAGVDIASFSANTAYWKVRYENSSRTLVAYKTVEGSGANGAAGANDWGPDGTQGNSDDALGADDIAGTADDHPENSTTTFRDNGAPNGDPNAPPGGRVGPNTPENALFGSMYVGDNSDNDYQLVVPAGNGAGEFAADSIWRQTGIPSGSSTTIPGNLVGWEWDAIPTQAQYLAHQPAGVKRVAESSVVGQAGNAFLHDEGRVYGLNPPPGQPGVSHAVRYTAPSGARVFAAGTIQWAWGLAPHFLDDPGAQQTYQDSPIDTSDPRIQQATYNLFADGGVQPNTPAGIVVDGNQPPTAAFTISPNPAAPGQTVTFNGSGSSDPGGSIAKYEWDLDGNGSLETDTGTTPTASRAYATNGSVSVKLRVTDNQGAQATVTHTLSVQGTTATYADTILGTSGLRHYWRLGETTGSSFGDSKGASPASHSGATLGVPGAIASDSDKAARFDGVNDFANADVNLGTSAVTLEFWLKWNAFANDDDLAFELTPNYNTNAGGLLVDPNDPTGRFQLSHRQGSSFQGYNTSVFNRPTAAAWHHYALVFDKTAGGNGEATVYLDGAPVSLTRASTTDTADTFASAALYFMSRAGNSLFGGGDLDEVALYGRALTAGEAADHYSIGTAGGGNQPPNASFTVTPNPATTGQTVAFNGTASSDPDGTITKYEWDLDGNGSFETDTGATPTTSRSYTTAGSVSVKLRVTDNQSGTSVATKTLTVQNPGGSLYSQTILGTSGLLHYWRMGETSGSTFADSKGSAPATASGASLGVPGALTGDSNGAARFDGTNDFASADLNLSNTGVITLEFWLKWNTFANDDDLAFEFTPNYNVNQGGFLVDPNDPTGRFQLSHRDGGFWSGYNTAVFNRPTPAAWHHYALVLDRPAAATNELKIYVDGAVASTTYANTSDTLSNFAQSTLYFMSRAGTALFGGGDLDEVAVYNRVLTAAEVADHHTIGSP